MKRKSKVLPFRRHEEATAESFRNDPEFAAEYLNAVLEDGDQEEMLLALRHMARAFGGVSNLAGEARAQCDVALPDVIAAGQPGAQEPDSAAEGDGNAACGPACSRTWGSPIANYSRPLKVLMCECWFLSG